MDWIAYEDRCKSKYIITKQEKVIQGIQDHSMQSDVGLQYILIYNGQILGLETTPLFTWSCLHILGLATGDILYLDSD